MSNPYIPGAKARLELEKQLKAYKRKGGKVKKVARGVTGLPDKFENWGFQCYLGKDFTKGSSVSSETEWEQNEQEWEE